MPVTVVVVGMDGRNAEHTFSIAVGTAGFAKAFRYVSWTGNLVDGRAEFMQGWGGGRIPWSGLKPCGFEAEGASGAVVLDADGRLPAASPWRATYGRDAGMEAK